MKKASVFVAIGILAALMIACVPSQAASAGIVEVYSKAGAPNFVITVENVGYFTLDDDYLNFTVQSDPTHTGVGTNATYYVHVSINDGTTNYTVNKTLAVKNDKTVWGNYSIANAVIIAQFTTNATATLGVLLKGPSLGTNNNYSSAEIAIFSSAIAGPILNLVPLIITVAILGCIIPMFAKLTKRK